jgi:5-methylcytosine-specific restriction endonuclease McrA
MPAFIRPSKRTAARNRRKATNYRRVCAQVDTRDGGFCRVCRRFCQATAHHHIVFRSQGGKDTTANLITVCVDCHADIHSRKVRVTGDANNTLQIERAA